MRIQLLTTLIAVLFLLPACNDSAEKASANVVAETTMPSKYNLTAFANSPEFPDASIESMDYKSGSFSFGVGGSSYELGQQTSDAETKMCANSGKGQHIHLIVDNGPYAAKYTADFDHDIADGEHHLLAFLSRSYHESIKTEAAHVAQKVNVENKSITSTEKITDPMLFYSRPKGTYVGKDTEKVMLDFYLANTSISGAGNKVKAEINGEVHMIDTWQPYYIEGMAMGENTIKLSLLDSAGELVDTPLNPVSRTFTLKEDPAPAK